MLELEAISVAYGDIPVIFGLSLRVKAGQIVSLIGGNGAGKTTTINTISGMLRPTGGDIRFEGASILDLPPHDRVARGIVQVPEGRMLFPKLTVRENLKLGAFQPALRRGLGRRMEEVWELFPRLRERMGQQAGTLSGGEQQMLAIGRGLMSAPRLLLLDEPSTGLAPVLVAEMFRAIRKINRRGVSILLIEQNAVQALRCAHHGYVLEQGHLFREGLPEALLTDAHIKAAYLGI
ncbi:MAG: ABC transporter ATP-binding protein [SAR324 cluster bacterium]|nr:ABC transporter ATP-binding protein [SAR324 cluster bacterium]